MSVQQGVDDEQAKARATAAANARASANTLRDLSDESRRYIMQHSEYIMHHSVHDVPAVLLREHLLISSGPGGRWRWPWHWQQLLRWLWLAVHRLRAALMPSAK